MPQPDEIKQNCRRVVARQLSGEPSCASSFSDTGSYLFVALPKPAQTWSPATLLPAKPL
jgi:hypothetical protein